MAKLNQIIAVVSGKKTQAERALTEIYHKLQKPTLFEGIARTYQPLDEEGETFPPENKRLQYRTTDACREASDVLTALLDAVATQDYANTEAKASVVVDGEALLEDVPVTYLLILEKQLVDLRTFVSKLPVLDPAEKWTWDPAVDCYSSNETRSNKTKKVMRNHVKAEATDKHPAQVETYTEDVKVGEWHTVKFSGAVAAGRKNLLLERVEKVVEAVKFAREEANNREVNNISVGRKLFGYVFAD